MIFIHLNLLNINFYICHKYCIIAILIILDIYINNYINFYILKFYEIFTLT